jgi:hypothetical protein
MTHLYGHKWTSVHGETAYDNGRLTEDAKTWASGLSGLSGDHVANGLRKCIDCGEAWPPGLPEFVAMCKGKAKNGFGMDYTPECYRDQPEVKALPIKKAQDEVKKSNMAEIKQKLGIKK